jgi:hypothetical protein
MKIETTAETPLSDPPSIAPEPSRPERKEPKEAEREFLEWRLELL